MLVEGRRVSSATHKRIKGTKQQGKSGCYLSFHVKGEPQTGVGLYNFILITYTVTAPCYKLLTHSILLHVTGFAQT